jgi:hypothetical protein
MSKIYITKKHINDSNQSGLDFELQDEFGFNYDDYEEFVETQKGHSSANSHPIRIDKLIEILQSLKSGGCSHVQIEYHCDHIGYDISGFEITLSSNEDIDSYERKQSERKFKNQKISELQKQINDLRNENTI